MFYFFYCQVSAIPSPNRNRENVSWRRHGSLEDVEKFFAIEIEEKVKLTSAKAKASFRLITRLHIGIFGAVPMIVGIDPGDRLKKKIALHTVVGSSLTKSFFT